MTNTVSVRIVVAYAMKNAGYDLMKLVNEDIISDPQAYGIDEPDINIDFRRVKNLKYILPGMLFLSQQIPMRSVNGREETL